MGDSFSRLYFLLTLKQIRKVLLQLWKYVWKFLGFFLSAAKSNGLLCQSSFFFCSTKSVGRTVWPLSNRITEHIKSNVKSCALSLNDCSSPWWIYWAGESCFYSQMNLFRTLMGAIKNDIFIFRLGGLTRTATVSYYSVQNGGFSWDLALLYIAAMPCCTPSEWAAFNRTIKYMFWL